MLYTDDANLVYLYVFFSIRTKKITRSLTFFLFPPSGGRKRASVGRGWPPVFPVSRPVNPVSYSVNSVSRPGFPVSRPVSPRTPPRHCGDLICTCGRHPGDTSVASTFHCRLTKNRRGAIYDARMTVANAKMTLLSSTFTAANARPHRPSRDGLLVPSRHRASQVAPLRFIIQMSFLRQLLVLSARLHYLSIR